MPEEMPSSLTFMDEERKDFNIIQYAPRLFWWGIKGATVSRDLNRWIMGGSYDNSQSGHC
jgi:hypothetical protein